MEWLTLISILVSFVIVINRIRKQDRDFARKADVFDERIRRLEVFTGLSELPADTDLTVDPLCFKLGKLEQDFYDRFNNSSND